MYEENMGNGDEKNTPQNDDFEQDVSNLNLGDDPEQKQQPVNEPPQFDPGSWKLNFKGQEIVPKDRDHLVNLAQKGYGYERAMEDLNRERQELEQQRTKYQQYQTLEQALAQNPQLANQMWSLVSQQGNQQFQQQSNYDEQETNPEILQLRQQLQEINTWREQLLNKEAEKYWDDQLNELVKQYPNDAWDKDDGQGTLRQRIMKHAYDNNLPNLNIAYKDYMWDSVRTRTEADALRKQKEAQQKQHRAGIVNNGNSNPPPPKQTGYKPGMSWNDISQRVLAEL